jgi:hypothetical protein
MITFVNIFEIGDFKHVVSELARTVPDGLKTNP